MTIHSIMVAVGSLGWLFCGYALFLCGWTLWKGERPKHAAKWMEYAGNLKRFKHKKIDGFVSGWYAYFLVIWCFGMGLAIARIPKPKIVTEHNVAITGRTSYGDFTFISDEEPKGGSFRPCSGDKEQGVDSPALLEQGVGWIAYYAVWEERGTCKSILSSDLGFWFVTKENPTPRRIQ